MNETIFVDQLRWASLIRVLMLRPCARTIWYFDAMSRPVRFALRLFRWAGLRCPEARQVAHDMDDVRSPDGASGYIRLLRDCLLYTSPSPRD